MILLKMKTGLILLLVLLSPAAALAADQDPTACIKEIEQVCFHLEDKLESCLADRGDQLSPDCRDQLKAAMALAQDPTGPAACIPDVQRLCPDLKPDVFARCMADQQSHFSDACQKYLLKARPE
jgi:hypothetical protein